MANSDTVATRQARHAALAKVDGCTFCGSRDCVWKRRARAAKARKPKHKK